MMDNTKAIIDYAQNDQGAEMRDALYSSIQDKVMAHIEAKKQEIAQNLFVQPQAEIEQDQEVENS